MPERGPEVTNGSMPTYSPPAAIEACMMAAATSFSDAPARTASRPARIPASLATAARRISASSRADFTRRSGSTRPEPSSSGPSAAVSRW